MTERTRVAAEVIGTFDLGRDQVAGRAAGPDDSFYLLLTRGAGAQGARVVCCAGARQGEHVIDDRLTAFSFVQPLPEGFLLASSRQVGSGPSARTYSADGMPIRDLDLGDGIEDIQTTASGAVWVSYFDEGAMGRTVGSAGLVCFDAQGRSNYRFQPVHGLDRIFDCYALNVENAHTVWFYYYTPFVLVRLHKMSVAGVWRPGLDGARAFAVFGRYVVMHAGYQRNDWQILRLNSDATTGSESLLEFVDEAGVPLPPSCACARGRLIWFFRNATVYRVDISMLELNCRR